MSRLSLLVFAAVTCIFSAEIAEANALRVTDFSGKASFYSQRSGKTASGEAYDHKKLTCAHPTLPFGTKLKVTYRDRSAIVVVNDRGPFTKGRVLDLSGGVAEALGLKGDGVILVRAIVQ